MRVEVSLNPQYEVLNQILLLDIEAGVASTDQRAAQKQLKELSKKTRAVEEVLTKTNSEIAYLEGEARRRYRKVDEVEERKVEKAQSLTNVRSDEEHRSAKRQSDSLEREARDLTRRAEEVEGQMEEQKTKYWELQKALDEIEGASSVEREKAEKAQQSSEGKLSEIAAKRDEFLKTLEPMVVGHYKNLSKVTRNPNGPITRITDKACGNCHLQLSAQLVNTVTTGKEVKFCPSCHHILLPKVAKKEEE